MDFKTDLEQIIKDEFNNMGITYTETDLRDLCIHFLNTKSKLIFKQKRRVLKSQEYEAKKTGKPYEAILDVIEKKIIDGEDLNPHLSKQSLKPKFDDLLLNDWAIHHIHISDTKANANQYFYDRSGDLLFVLVIHDSAYFIDVRSHNENNVFSKKEFIGIIQNNWAEILEPSEIKGAVGLSHDCTDEEITKLRRAGINVLIQVNDKIYCSMGMGYAASGDSAKNVMDTHAILKSIEQREKQLTEEKEDIKKDIEAKLGHAIEEIDFKLELVEQNLLVKETTSGLYL